MGSNPDREIDRLQSRRITRRKCLEPYGLEHFDLVSSSSSEAA